MTNLLRKKKEKLTLTPKEEEVMKILWQHGPLSVREMLEYYEEPLPHVNTVSTVVRLLEERGLVAHEPSGAAYKYYAVAEMEEFRDRSLGKIVSDYFGNSYLNAVSTLLKDEKISADELRELLSMIEKNDKL